MTRYTLWVKWTNVGRTRTDWVARSSYSTLADAIYNFEVITSVPAEIRLGNEVIASNGVVA